MRFLLWTTAILAMLLSLSCISSDIPLVSEDIAVTVPGLEGSWSYEDPEDPMELVVEGREGSPSYTVRDNGGSQPLTMLLAPVVDDYYLVELSGEGEPVTTVIKYQGDAIHVLLLNEHREALQQAMNELGMDSSWVDFGEFGIHYQGPDRQAFIDLVALAAPGLPLDPDMAYKRVRP